MILRRVFTFILFLTAYSLAVVYSGIWQSQTYPTADASIKLKSGPVIRGELSRTWSNDWALALDNGTSMRIPEQEIAAITFPVRAESQSMWGVWRSWFPVTLVCGIFLVYLLRPFLLSNPLQSHLQKQ